MPKIPNYTKAADGPFLLRWSHDGTPGFAVVCEKRHNPTVDAECDGQRGRWHVEARCENSATAVGPNKGTARKAEARKIAVRFMRLHPRSPGDFK